MATHSSILAWRIPWTEEPGGHGPRGHRESDTTEVTEHTRTHSSVGKESACNAEDPGSIPGSGRSTGEGIGYPLQYSWASLVVQLVKNLPTMRETWVWSLGWEDPVKKGKATHSSILAWRIPWTKSPSKGSQRETRQSDFHFQVYVKLINTNYILGS